MSIEKYKEFVDTFVDKLSRLGIKLEYVCSCCADKERARKFIAGLTDEERDMIREMVSHACKLGAHRTLETLEFLRDFQRLSISLDGLIILDKPFGNDLQTDWDERMKGKPWGNVGKCPVHDVQFSAGTAEIHYGLIRDTKDYSDASEKLFPYSRYALRAGCIVRAVESVGIVFCPKCREAHVKWCREHDLYFDLPLSMIKSMEK